MNNIKPLNFTAAALIMDTWTSGRSRCPDYKGCKVQLGFQFTERGRIIVHTFDTRVNKQPTLPVHAVWVVYYHPRHITADDAPKPSGEIPCLCQSLKTC